MIRWLERKFHEARKEREAEEYRAAVLKSAPSCPHCDGEGQIRVRGVRTVTGYEVCYHCQGSGKDVLI